MHIKHNSTRPAPSHAAKGSNPNVLINMVRTLRRIVDQKVYVLRIDLARLCERISGQRFHVGARVIACCAAGVLLDLGIAALCARWSFPADSYRLAIVTDAEGNILSSRLGPRVCTLIPEHAEVKQPADVSDPNAPVPLRWEDNGASRGWAFHIWRSWIAKMHRHRAMTRDEILPGSISYIRFGFPFRSWEAWWHDDGSVSPGGFATGPQPIGGLRIGGTILTTWGRVPRAVPIAARPGLVAINACVYGAAFAGVWYSVRGWRRRRAITKLGRCPTCGYALAGLKTRICPECGESASAPVLPSEPASSKPE